MNGTEAWARRDDHKDIRDRLDMPQGWIAGASSPPPRSSSPGRGSSLRLHDPRRESSRLNGLELQKRIAGDRKDLLIIFITGHRDVPMTVSAMKPVLPNS